jgi:phage shock protein E
MLQNLFRLGPGPASRQNAPAASAATPAIPAQLPASPAAECGANPQPDGPPARLVIDVRTEREFAQSAVVGAINMPLSQLERRIGALAADPATPLVVYCASGARSSAACALLHQMGYGQVSNAGGLYAAAAQLQLGLR